MSIKKKVLLLLPDDYSLYSLIESNVKYIGYEPITILHNSVRFKYKNLFQRLYNLYRKLIDGNNQYKKKLIKETIAKEIIKKIDFHDRFDYCLVLRSDFFDDSVLLRAQEKSAKIVSYHYDSLKDNLIVLNNIKFFDKLYVFDNDDLSLNSNLELSHNFYFDYDDVTSIDFRYDIYYLGFYNKGREKMIFSFIKQAKEVLNNILFEVVFPPQDREKKKIYEANNINCLNNVIPFNNYLNNIQDSKYIVDFLIDKHEGLSFRIFEGLKYKKKVITTNVTVITYDFYHPNNFLVINEQNLSVDFLKEFFALPYVEISPDIRHKYSFTGWFKTIFNY